MYRPYPIGGKRTRSVFNGFTLVELLVVIVIIAILAAMIFPVMAEAKEKGRQATCLSNIRQLSAALQLYVADHGERYPGSGEQGRCEKAAFDNRYPTWMRGIHVSSQSSWVPCHGILEKWWDPMSEVTKIWQDTGPKAGVLYPYLREWTVFSCPSDKRRYEKCLSYSMNAIAGYIPASEVDRPAEFVVLIDEQLTLNDSFFLAFDGGEARDCPGNQHTGGTSFAFFDGHAKRFVAAKKPKIGDCQNSVPARLFCPKIPLNDAPIYAPFCNAE
ncbi:MAG: hypothetical protein HONBIEJF_00842 [Fimbriimonadaceae bacterium]|nr:hypothetical protein [Fimbriimonadaceae bacterium]